MKELKEEWRKLPRYGKISPLAILVGMILLCIPAVFKSSLGHWLASVLFIGGFIVWLYAVSQINSTMRAVMAALMLIIGGAIIANMDRIYELIMNKPLDNDSSPWVVWPLGLLWYGLMMGGLYNFTKAHRGRPYHISSLKAGEYLIRNADLDVVSGHLYLVIMYNGERLFYEITPQDCKQLEERSLNPNLPFTRLHKVDKPAGNYPRYEIRLEQADLKAA